jgi:hypothetical protein
LVRPLMRMRRRSLVMVSSHLTNLSMRDVDCTCFRKLKSVSF